MTYHCRQCGAPFERLIDVRVHAGREHGSTGGQFGAGRGNPGPRIRTPRPRLHRRIEDVGEGSTTATGGETPAQDHGAEGIGTQARADDPADPSPTPRTEPRIASPIVRIAPEQTAQGVREAVRDALPMSLLADLIGTLSRTISEWDGAGEAGWLSPIQCTQVASLMYDSTVEFVVVRFAGNVTRFKAFLAVVVILASKGSVHARAIRAKITTSTQARLADAAAPVPAANIESNGHAPGFELDPMSAAARERERLLRQRLGE